MGSTLLAWGRGWPFLLGVAVVQLCVVIILVWLRSRSGVRQGLALGVGSAIGVGVGPSFFGFGVGPSFSWVEVGPFGRGWLFLLWVGCPLG